MLVPSFRFHWRRTNKQLYGSFKQPKCPVFQIFHKIYQTFEKVKTPCSYLLFLVCFCCMQWSLYYRSIRYDPSLGYYRFNYTCAYLHFKEIFINFQAIQLDRLVCVKFCNGHLTPFLASARSDIWYTLLIFMTIQNKPIRTG